MTDKSNGRRYVGQTTRSLSARREFAIWLSRRRHNPINRAIREKGIDTFTWEVLRRCRSREELDLYEARLIHSMNTLAPNGYNLSEGVASMDELKKKYRRRLAFEIWRDRQAVCEAQGSPA